MIEPGQKPAAGRFAITDGVPERARRFMELADDALDDAADLLERPLVGDAGEVLASMLSEEPSGLQHVDGHQSRGDLAQ
jgi:hypothetical protein